MTTTFIGIDLAWQSERNATGITVARETEAGHGAVIIDVVAGLRGLTAIVTLVERYTTDDTVIAIDAPLIIRNATGRRPCETEISKRFGARHASAHSSNLKLYPDPATHALVRHLQQSGFRHDVPPERRSRGRWFFEVYPHPHTS